MIAAGERYREAILREISAVFDRRIERAERHSSPIAAVWRHAAGCVDGGKMLRPLMLMGAFEALREDDDDATLTAAIRVAACIELLHYTFLLHDDVIDGDLERRGRPNLIGALAAEQRSDAPQRDISARPIHWGQSSAILLGDMLLSEVHQLIAALEVPGSRREDLLELLEETITETVIGEHLDVALADRVIDPDAETVLEMTRLKTAGYTFEFPLRAAAILAGASAEVATTAGRLGRRLGGLFQLQDDLFSTFGQSDTHGKDAFSDLREGKQTAIIAYARTRPEWPRISDMIETVPPADAAGIRDLLAESGAAVHVETLIASDVREIERELQDSPHLTGPVRTFLSDVTTTVRDRRR